VDFTRYDHAEGWAIEFQIPVQTLRERLKGLPSLPVTDASGKPIAYFAEEDVRRACKDLLAQARSFGRVNR